MGIKLNKELTPLAYEAEQVMNGHRYQVDWAGYTAIYFNLKHYNLMTPEIELELFPFLMAESGTQQATSTYNTFKKKY